MDDFILATEVTQSNAMVLAHHTKSPTATNQPTSSDDTNTSVKDESLHNVTTEESSYESHYIAPRQNPIRERHPPARLQDCKTLSLTSQGIHCPTMCLIKNCHLNTLLFFVMYLSMLSLSLSNKQINHKFGSKLCKMKCMPLINIKPGAL
ncbi:hypothetical protein ACFX12_034715 [Malus domestica]